MAHLKEFREGWQNENLARFILYKFAFVAEPSKVADDIGVDFFCTLFTTEHRQSHVFLVPRSAFALQVKPEIQSLVLTKHLAYLNKLELPYLVGLSNASNLTLTIYSGEYLQHFFLLKGDRDDITGKSHKISAKFCDRNFDPHEWYQQEENGEFILLFPKVTILDVKDHEELLDEKVHAIQDIVQSIAENIALRASNRATLKIYGTTSLQSFAGRNSANYFQDNLIYALTEVFGNLAWLINNVENPDVVVRHFQMYEGIYEEFKRGSGLNTISIEQAYQRARDRILAK